MLYQVINGADTGKIKDVAISMKSETQSEESEDFEVRNN
jgi:hypothetical protein